MTESRAKPDSRKILLGGAIFLAGLLGMLVLFFFNPIQYGFYPTCWFHRLTGLDCPGCGSLRALHQLLHGNVRTAFGLNPLLVSALPLVGLLLINQAIFAFRGKKIFTLNLSTNWLWYLLAVLIVFTVIRNIPMFL